MSKYQDYLDEILKELQELQDETERLEQPSHQLNRMGEYYRKAQELEGFFQKGSSNYGYKKGSGEYREFLTAQKRGYQWGWRPENQEEKIKKSFEKKATSPPRSGRKGGYSPWNREDWMIYEAVQGGNLDYSSNGFFHQRW